MKGKVLSPMASTVTIPSSLSNRAEVFCSRPPLQGGAPCAEVLDVGAQGFKLSDPSLLQSLATSLPFGPAKKAAAAASSVQVGAATRMPCCSAPGRDEERSDNTITLSPFAGTPMSYFIS